MGIKVFKDGAWEETTGYMVKKADLIPIHIPYSQTTKYIETSEYLKEGSHSLYISKHFLIDRVVSAKTSQELKTNERYMLFRINGTAIHENILKTNAFFSTIGGLCNINIGTNASYPSNCYCFPSGDIYLEPFTVIPEGTYLDIMVFYMIGEFS